MLETLIITFREGVEIALIVGILLVYLRTNDKSELKKYVHFGLAASLVASVIVAVILEKLSLDYELFEGYLMFIAAAFVTTMIVWMWRTSRHIRNDIEQKVGGMVKEATSSWRLMLGVFLFTFLMVAREGIETVIFLRAASGSTVFSSGVLGAVLGIALSVAFGVFFVKGSIRVDVGRFLNVTAIVLLIFIAQLIVNGVHEFYELGVFPASPKMMGIVGPIVRNNLLFILAIVSIPAIMFIIPARKTSQEKTPGRPWQLSAGFVCLSVIFFLGFESVFASKSSVEISRPEPVQAPVQAVEGVIKVPVDQLIDGKLHRFVWVDNDGTHIRFFSLRTGTGSFATAFDACRACYNYGFYYMKDGELICSVCEAPSRAHLFGLRSSVGIKQAGRGHGGSGGTKRVDGRNGLRQSGSMEGMGCAPIYLPSLLVEGNVEVKVSELLKHKKYFQTSLDPSTMTFTPNVK
ncbi:MAG: DUF2318 domain-containing protein [Bacteroidetes bacterium]|nr:DUF2318 domain-containing protein [Bacteroidota bacterium]